jgi:hypothetical protein
MVARRQARLTERSLDEQRQSFREQSEIARRQAQLTEGSLTEQNERVRLNLELDLLTRLGERFESSHFLKRRRTAAKYLLDNAFVEDDSLEVPPLNRAAIDVCSFYDELGELQRLGVLRAELVWNRFGVLGQAYWPLCKLAIEKMREEDKEPTYFEDFEYLMRLIVDMNRERGVPAPTQERLRQTMEDEAVVGEEPPALTE